MALLGACSMYPEEQFLTWLLLRALFVLPSYPRHRCLVSVRMLFKSSVPRRAPQACRDRTLSACSLLSTSPLANTASFIHGMSVIYGLDFLFNRQWTPCLSHSHSRRPKSGSGFFRPTGPRPVAFQGRTVRFCTRGTATPMKLRTCSLPFSVELLPGTCLASPLGP